VTSAGRAVAARRALRCPRCGTTAYPADDRLGLDGFLSPGATRLACMAAASWSFDVAAARLEAMAGVRLDDETIRRHVHKAAGPLRRRREQSPPTGPAEAVAAGGEAELLTDGVLAPTRDGWRELKMARLLARPRGEPAEVADWADRELPAPTAGTSTAMLADCEAFAATWRPWIERLGLDPDGPLTILGDGAAWIWSAAEEHFPAAAQVLDIYHASQHLAAAAAGLYGEGTAAAADWMDRARAALLADGRPGLLDHVGATPAGGRTEAGRAALEEMLGYFAKHAGRVGYYGRLRTGRSIGSGAVEGLARRMGLRLKVPGRGWLAGHLDGMATLLATIDTPEWEGLWSRPAA
jgi:hypothetical protein